MLSLLSIMTLGFMINKYPGAAQCGANSDLLTSFEAVADHLYCKSPEVDAILNTPGCVVPGRIHIQHCGEGLIVGLESQNLPGSSRTGLGVL